MHNIQLPDSQVALSRLVYGVWRLADDSNTSTDQVRRKIDRCLEQGITSFDHADIYGNYECERLFGQALHADSSLREQMQLISKCDIALASDKYPQRRVKHYDTSAAYINQSVENSLKYLHTDYLDLLLIHRPDPFMDATETGLALDALIDSGKVKAVGVSNFRADQWRLLQSRMRHKLCVNQIEMSVLEQAAFVDGTLDAMQLDNIQAMAWSPLAGGRLFSDEAAAKRVKPLLQQAAEPVGGRLDLAAFAWLLAHPAKILPVVGTNNLERISGLADALKIEMDRETWFEIWTASAGIEVP